MQVCALLTGVIVLCENGFSSENQPEVYVLLDTVQDTTAPIMKLSVKKVEGIDEPIKLIEASVISDADHQQ